MGAEETSARLQQERGWIILLDWMLPYLDGRQGLARLQADPTLLTDTKVVVMSVGWRLDQERPALASRMAAAHLSKPFEPEAVLDLVHHPDGTAG